MVTYSEKLSLAELSRGHHETETTEIKKTIASQITPDMFANFDLLIDIHIGMMVLKNG